MTNQNITLTDEILAGMLTENTGSHMLDSGGAYGRHWERNQGLDVQTLIDRPAVHVTEYGIDLDLFHYLRERIEFVPDIQAEFDEFAQLPENKDTSWYELMADFRELYPCEGYNGYNSYNYDCLLSQTIQGDYIQWHDGGIYLMLQIHGGCDVRGGYTAPKIFREYNDPGAIQYDWNSYSIQSADDRKGEPVALDFLHGEIYDRDGEYIGNAYRWKRSEDDHPLLDWFSDMKWDEDTQSFLAPDGDGHIEFIEPYAS